MTYPSALAQINAVLTVLNGTANVRAYLGQAPKSPTYPLVVVYAAPGTTSGTVGDRLRDLTVAFQTTCVAGTAEQAMWLVDQVHGALDKVAPTVAGRTAFPIRLLATQPVHRDDTLLDPYFYGTAQWEFQTSV